MMGLHRLRPKVKNHNQTRTHNKWSYSLMPTVSSNEPKSRQPDSKKNFPFPLTPLAWYELPLSFYTTCLILLSYHYATMQYGISLPSLYCSFVQNNGNRGTSHHCTLYAQHYSITDYSCIIALNTDVRTTDYS